MTNNSVPLEQLLAAPTLPPNVPPFTVIRACEFADPAVESDDEYASSTEATDEVFPCECSQASGCCGPDSGCINRELFVECPEGECPCGERCQNQRFGRREYARVKVVETPGKGFGLFACEDLKAGTFIMEYVGEIVDKDEMADRSAAYAASSQRHFYFMTLRPDRIIDATRKGNISRFMNHSCAPNCETQKWIVQGRLRIGLFTVKAVKAGSELCFDYKFVRYGKEPQKCLCGEECCTGFIGVSEDPNKKRPSRKESDPEAELLALGCLQDPEDAVTLIGLLRNSQQCKDLPALLRCLLETTDSLCLRKFMSLHGLKVLAVLARNRPEVLESCLQVLQILPIGSINSVEDSGWMELIEELSQQKSQAQDSDASSATRQLSQQLKTKFSSLQRIFKIPKKPRASSRSVSPVQSASSSPDDRPGESIVAVPEQFSQALQQRKRGAFDMQKESRWDSRREGSREGSRDDRRDGSRNTRESWDSRNTRESRESRYNRYDHDSRDTRDSRDSRYEHDTRDSRDSRYTRDTRYHDSRDYRDRRDNRDASRNYSRDSSLPRDSRESYRPTPATAAIPSIPDPNWLEASTETGEKYYYHRDTRETAWTRPMIPASHAPPPARAAAAGSSLLEGARDDQLAAIIDRAKARRSQQPEEAQLDQEVERPATNLDIFSLINTSTSTSQSSSNNNPNKQFLAKIKDQVSEVVVRFLSHYKSQLGDDFKDAARRYTHRILEKETAAAGAGEAFEMNSRKRAKIKAYLAEAMKGRNIKLLPEHEILLK